MYASATVDELLSAFPDRTLSSLRQRAHKMGLCYETHWTDAEDARLIFMWETPLALASIATRMGRTPLAIYSRAKKIGLSVGCPDGFEYVSTAAKRTGFELATLRRVLAFSRVKEHRSLAQPKRTRRYQSHHFVCIDSVNDAVVKWHASEPVTAAARRRGLSQLTLRRWLIDAGALSKSRAWKKHHRIDSEIIDLVISNRAPTRELLSAAGRRGGLSKAQRTRHAEECGSEQRR
jgi:hypothetical protein